MEEVMWTPIMDSPTPWLLCVEFHGPRPILFASSGWRRLTLADSLYFVGDMKHGESTSEQRTCLIGMMWAVFFNNG